ncbi:MAG: lytic transglycosylase domain-containing protein [Synergistaceae bacterium]|nr:lytic transglycosylase domain-containing protein [Synergistaceae bacterium]
MPLAVSIYRKDASEKWNDGWHAWRNNNPAAALKHWSEIGVSGNFTVRPSRICYWRIRAMEKLGMYAEADDLKAELARKYPFDFYTFLFFRDGGAGISDKACRVKAESLFYPYLWKEEVSDAAGRTGIPEVMIWSLMKQESKFRKNAVSRSGALGLMQLMPSTAKAEMRYLNILSAEITDPEKNDLIGASYFSRLSRKFKGDLPRAIAAYNAGMMPVVRWNTLSAQDWIEWIEEIPYSETREFVRSVLQNREMYNIISGEKNEPSVSSLISERPMPVEKIASANR